MLLFIIFISSSHFPVVTLLSVLAWIPAWMARLWPVPGYPLGGRSPDPDPRPRAQEAAEPHHRRPEVRRLPGEARHREPGRRVPGRHGLGGRWRVDPSPVCSVHPRAAGCHTALRWGTHRPPFILWQLWCSEPPEKQIFTAEKLRHSLIQRSLLLTFWALYVLPDLFLHICRLHFCSICGCPFTQMDPVIRVHET